MTEYPDTNSNGIPDAFENRRPIIELLKEAEMLDLGADGGTVVIEIESRPRSPKEGEIFIVDGVFYRASRDMFYTVLIVREVISGPIHIRPFR